MREEAIRDPLWVLADFAPRELENRAALRWAGDVLDALRPFVVLRSEMEQVECPRCRGEGSVPRVLTDRQGHTSTDPERHWVKCPTCGWGDSFYVLRAGGGEDQ